MSEHKENLSIDPQAIGELSAKELEEIKIILDKDESSKSDNSTETSVIPLQNNPDISESNTKSNDNKNSKMVFIAVLAIVVSFMSLIGVVGFLLLNNSNNSNEAVPTNINLAIDEPFDIVGTDEIEEEAEIDYYNENNNDYHHQYYTSEDYGDEIYEDDLDHLIEQQQTEQDLPPPPQIFTVNATSGSGGTVSGGGTVDENSNVTLQATPNIGWTFSAWYEGETRVNSNAAWSFTATQDRTLQARFVQATFSVSSSSNNVIFGRGAVWTGVGGEREADWVISRDFTHGSTVHLRAFANHGYAFERWEVVSGNITFNDATSRSTSFIMPAENVSVMAVFSLHRFFIVNAGALNIRAAPNIESNVIGRLERGDIVEVTQIVAATDELHGDWAWIGHGWSNMDYLLPWDYDGTPSLAIPRAVTTFDYITIRGVQYSTSLTYLNLRENDLRNEDIVQLRYMRNLISLNLNDNRISDLTPISELSNLTELFLSDNLISDLTSLSGLVNLNTLGLRRNQINNITPIRNLTNLTLLTLQSNQISDLTPLSNLTNLREVELRDNPVTNWTPLSHVSVVHGRPTLSMLQIHEIVGVYEGWYYTTDTDRRFYIRFTIYENSSNNLEALIEYFIPYPPYNNRLGGQYTGSYIMSVSGDNYHGYRFELLRWRNQRHNYHSHANFVGHFHSNGNFSGTVYRNWGNSQFESTFYTSRNSSFG